MKIIVGILRDSKDQIESYKEKGYHIECLDKHANAFGSKLLGSSSLSQEDILKVRKKGYGVSSMFWVNLAMMSAKDFDKIALVNLQEEDNKKFLSKVV